MHPEYTEYPEIILKKHRPKRGEKTTRFEVVVPCRFWHLGKVYEIPAGFKTDFASVPRSLWSIIPPHGLATVPSIKHDYIYINRVGEAEFGRYAARLAGDNVFHFDLLLEGMSETQAKLMHDTVRTHGESYWLKN